MAVEFHALADEAIHGGRLAKPPVPADVTPAEVIGHDDEDVWPWRLRGDADAIGTGECHQCEEEACRGEL